MSSEDYTKNVGGRIYYIEPTNLFSDKNRNILTKGEGSMSDAINHPYDDYSMAVDLSVTISNRYSCGLPQKTGEQKEFGFTSTNGTISFLGGTNIGGKQKYLTTTYTDVSMTNPGQNTNECLGIESITITYNSWQYPEVTIKFIDVRGATVMQNAENGYYNSEAATNLIYKSLFTFPYPIFTLKVKGFYGKGATYRLAVLKTNIEFDASSGNFLITATFIGYMFGIYADLPMTLIGIAPYTDDGEEYWKKSIDDGTFTFRDSNGEYQSDMIRIPELREKVALAAASEEGISAAAEGKTIQDNYDAQIQTLNSLLETYPFIGYYEGESCFYKVIFSDETESKSVKGEVISEYKKIYGYATSLSGYDATYQTHYLEKLNQIISEDYKKNPTDENIIKSAEKAIVVNYIFDTFEEKHVINSAISDVTNRLTYIRGKNDVEKYINSQMNNKKKNFSILIIIKSELNLRESIIEQLKEDEKNISIDKINSEKAYKEKVASAVEKILGFRPSIKNIYDLIFAHIDTFMHCFYNKMGIIRTQLEHSEEQPERKKSTYELDDKSTDTPSSSMGTIYNLLPPFPAFYDTDYLGNIGMIWPGDKTDAYGKKFEEVEYVKEILNAGKIYSEKASEIEKTIAAANDNTGEDTKNIQRNNSTNSNGKSPTLNVTTFIPITTYDFINKDRITNPYLGIKRMVINGNDSIDGEVLGMFALRSFYYLCTNKKNSGEARSFGVIDAINFYKAVGDSVSSNFIKFIKKYSENRNAGQDAENFLNLIKTRSTAGGEYKEASSWLMNGDGSNPLFIETNGNLKFSLHSDKVNDNDISMMPIYPRGFSNIKKDYSNDGYLLLTNRDYITTVNLQLMSGNTESGIKNKYPAEGGTFVVYEDRDYIKQIFSSVETEMRTSQEHIASTRENYGKRDDSEYGGIVAIDSTLSNYKNNIKTKFLENSYKEGVFINNEGNKLSKTEINKILSDGSFNDKKEVYIYTPIGEDNINGDLYENSLFTNSIYIKSNTIEKAYYFLMNLPFTENSLDKESENGLVLKAKLLKEGAWYWGIYNYKEGDNIIYKFTAPQNATTSRINYLIKYFKDWALSEDNENGFAANVKRLENKELYQVGKITSNNGKVLTRLDINLSQGEKVSRTGTEARNLQVFLRNLMLEVCTTFDYYNGIYKNEGDIFSYDSDKKVIIKIGSGICSCDENLLYDSFRGFMDELHEIYGSAVNDITTNNEYITKMNAAATTDPFNSKDLKLSVYRTLKTLYDKWLCCPYKEYEKLWSLNSQESDFQSFIYIDSFYNEIGHKITVNINKVSEWLSSCMPTSNLNSGEGELLYTGRTVYEFLSEVAQSCGGMLMAMPQKFGLNTKENIKDMFRPIPIEEISKWDTDESAFVFMYTYQLSEHLGEGDSNASNCDMNGFSPKGDGFSLTEEDIMGTSLEIKNDHTYDIPAFGVTYAKQNQSIFKNISLNTESAGITEAAIAATMNIASKASESPRETMLFGQDIYRVFSNYAYQCGAEMMGNMQVMPLMYFQLNNVPMWKGAYMIKKVSHNITNGNIITNFEGVRLNKYAIPIAECVALVEKSTGSEGQKNNDKVKKRTENLSSGNQSGEALRNETGKQSEQIEDTIDFDEGNVSPQKPIICVVAGHGPNTDKKLEWQCMYKMVTKMVDLLKKETYSDGTQFNVQLCNKNGNHTRGIGFTGKGYSTIEIQRIIKKYGSNNVISVACHWNGGAGNYHGVFLNRLDRGVREDSKIFASYMQAAFEDVKNGGPYEDMPDGMINGACNIYNLENSVDDGGPNQKCACVLTENWFADYGCKNSNLRWDIGDRGDKGTGRYWLTSEKETGGINVLAKAHVNGIKRYINSLSES